MLGIIINKGFILNMYVRSNSGIRILYIEIIGIIRADSILQMFRSKIVKYNTLIINVSVVIGKIKLKDDGSNDEKISGIMNKT